MNSITCDVLVIGGGATGTGIVRDLAMRGVKTILVERRDLAYGTTGRYHGLLHSGGRYVVKDPQAARECYLENLILRKIMPQCIEDTGGFFVLTPWDEDTYVPKFIEGCHQAGIPVEELTVNQMLLEEPHLNPKITRCFRVPDGSADSFLAANLNAESARQYGAQILTYHQVKNLCCEKHLVTGAVCHDLVKDEEVMIQASLVVNAAGAWAGKIASSAGIRVQMIPGKGTMVALNHRIVHTVINRCKSPSDGDILVPAHTVSVMGTTDIKVTDPDHFGIEPWELRLMLDEGDKMIPGFATFRILRAWAGVRPLFQETITTSENRDVTRGFILLDHEQRDGVKGILTITGGKWTTYRKMAEVTSDKVCEILGVSSQCRTHLEPLPGEVVTRNHNTDNQLSHYHHLGHRLAKIEAEKKYGTLVCECELVTQDDLIQASLRSDIHTLDDMRRYTRLGMGPCQSGFCSLRAAGLLHTLRHLDVHQTNAVIRDFLEERWKGQLPILYGQQLRQARLNQLIYIDVLTVGKLPEPSESRLSVSKYTAEYSDQPSTPPSSHTNSIKSTRSFRSHSSSQSDILVIGAGLAGLTAGWSALKKGKRVKIITKGWGATHWGSGCIDFLDATNLDAFISLYPDHPYALAGIPTIEKITKRFIDLCASSGYPMRGSPSASWMLPTALGTVRTTCLAPDTMIAGDIRQRSPMLIVGFSQFLDFYPDLISDNLNSQSIIAKAITLDLQSLQDRHFVSGMVLANLFDTPEFRTEVADALRPRLSGVSRLGFPAVLGLNNATEVIQDLERLLGVPVFEIPGLPPSIPGIRLHTILCNEIIRLGGEIHTGMQVEGCEASGHHLRNVFSEAAARRNQHNASNFILATGGILGGGIHLDQDGSVRDTALNLPIQTPLNRESWHHDTFISDEPHPFHKIGFAINRDFQPLDLHIKLIFDNLYVVGGAIGGFDPILDHSLEGIALVTGALVGERLS